MTNRIYLGNLSWDTTEEGLRVAIGQEGRTVKSVAIKTDKSSGRSRGFAFAELGSDEEAQAAIAALDGSELDGRPIKVKEAREVKVRSGGYGRSGGSDYGDRGGYGGRGGGGGGRGRRW